MGLKKNKKATFRNVNYKDIHHHEVKTQYDNFLKYIKIFLIISFILALLVSFVMFVVIPISFMCSLKLQTFIVFLNVEKPKNPEYENFTKYGVYGLRNLYVNVTDFSSNKTVSLGVWHLLPEELVDTNISNSEHEFDLLLERSKYPVVIFFHGNGGTRIYSLNTYLVLRKFFHVIAFDYRGYGDSTPAPLSEQAVVKDSIQLYKWVKNKTSSLILVYGHSLGTGLSTHVVKKLRQEFIVPAGLILEAPFPNLRSAVRLHPMSKIFSWLPYYSITILDPLERNGFHFNTIENILDVECPILIMTAEDDHIIPFTQGYELAKAVRSNRNQTFQNYVFYYQFPASLGYGHVGLINDPNIPKYINNFSDVCRKFKLKTE